MKISDIPTPFLEKPEPLLSRPLYKEEGAERFKLYFSFFKLRK